MVTEKSDFSKGSILSRILQIALPMTTALLVNILYNIVDRMFIGHIPEEGTLALTGIGLAFPITVMISAFQNLCSNGGAPLFSIERGKGETKEAEQIIGNSYLMLLFLGVVLTVIGYLAKEPVLWMIGADSVTFSYANDYLSVYLAGTVFVMTSLGMNPFINAQGAAKTGMMTVILGASLNLILDPIMIYGMNMGVKGAALASVLSQMASCIWTHAYFLGKRSEYHLRLSALKPDWLLIAKISGLGVTGFIASVTNSAVTMIYNAELSVLGGTLWVTAMTVVSSVREIVLMPMQGFTNGAQPVLGFNYGAGKYDRVRQAIRITTYVAFAYQTFSWLILMLFPQIFVSLFNSDPLLLEYGAEGTRLFFCLTMFFAFQNAGQAVFVALGKTKRAVFFSLLRKAFLVIPLAFVLPKVFDLGVKGIFLSEPVSDVIGGCTCWLTMYFSLYRKLPRVNRAD